MRLQYRALVERELASIEPDWFCVGRKRDVSKGACFIGHYRGCCVCVSPGGLEAMAEFALAARKLPTLIKQVQMLINPGSVKASPGDRG